MSDDTLRAARRDLLDIMRRMDCQDLFDDAFYALVRYERVALAASATDEPVGPVRIRSANCQAGDHDECLGMVEQDTPGLGITDCLCQCHPFAASATEERKPTHDHPDPEPMGRVGCLACELRLAASATDEGVCLRHRMVGFISAVPGCAACRAAALRSRPAAPVALDVERAEADR